MVVIGATVQGTVLKGENLADTAATAKGAVLNGGSPATIVVIGAAVQGTVLKGEDLADTVATAGKTDLNGDGGKDVAEAAADEERLHGDVMSSTDGDRSRQRLREGLRRRSIGSQNVLIFLVPEVEGGQLPAHASIAS